MRRTRRTELFKKLKSLLPEYFGDQKFAFFDDPFEGLKHPLLWAEREKEHDPVSRLFKLWAKLNDFNVKQLRPALEANDVVLVDGYGLNALLYATAYVGDNVEDDEEVAAMHHHIVRGRVIGQNIPAPEYFITTAECNAHTAYLQETVPGLSVQQCHAFIRKEERMIANYFGPATGQSGQFLNTSLSIDEMVEIVASAIERGLVENRQAA